MTKNSSLLVIGHSHTSCIEAAVQANQEVDQIRVVNLRTVTERGMTVDDVVVAILDEIGSFSPKAVCLSIGGNYHNVLGIVEDPIPFSVGDREFGQVPVSTDIRHFIPSSVMADIFAKNFDSKRAEKIYAAFPNTIRLYLNSPPPIPDFEHIRKNPGIFRDKLHLGSVPMDLRLKLYQIFSDTVSSFAKSQGAVFVNPAQSLLDENGFLSEVCFQNDPTHGNTYYGRVMLQELKNVVEREL